MIQVIQRTFTVLKRLNPDQGVGLGQLARDCSLNKSTLCNILKTLLDLGYVEKCGNGRYLISRQFFRLAYPFSRQEVINRIARNYAENLAQETEESVVVAALAGAKVQIITQSQFDRTLMVNLGSYKDLSTYHSVSGRVLLSWLDEERWPDIVNAMGWPGPEWNNIENWSQWRCEVEKIKAEGMAVMSNPCREIKSFAVPVFDREGRICVSLGMTVPLSRLQPAKEKTIVEALCDNAGKFTAALAAESVDQDDFFNEFSNRENRAVRED